MINPEKVKAAAKNAMDLLQERRGGYDNQEALRELSGLISDMLTYSDHDVRIAEKTTTLKVFAEKYFSPRKHRQYDIPGSASGLDQTRSHAYSAAYTIHNIADSLSPDE